MPAGDAAGQRFAGGRENKPAVFFVLEQAIRVEALHHVGDTGLRNLEAGRDIDHARVALRADQLENALEVIFDGDGTASRIGFGWHDDPKIRITFGIRSKEKIFAIDRLIVINN